MTHSWSQYRLVVCVLLCLFPAVSGAADKKPTSLQDRHEIVRIMAGELLAGLNPKIEISKPKSTLSGRLKKSAWELKQWWDEKTPDNAPHFHRARLAPPRSCHAQLSALKTLAPETDHKAAIE